MAMPIYLYSVFCLVWWLITWLGDACQIKYGFSCKGNAAEQLTARMLSILLLYMGVIPLILARKNRGNDPFLKRLAFHLQYGLMALIGCGMARSPPPPEMDGQPEAGDDESWYHVSDKIFLFLTFFLLFAYTAKSNEAEGPPTVMVQPPHKGHGLVPRTFLLVFGIAGILPLVKKYPLTSIVLDDVEITERAKFFYAMTQSAGLAVLMIIFVPLHFGSDQDQWDTTFTLIIVQAIFGVLMFRGEAWDDWINPSVHKPLLVGPLVFLGFAVLALGVGARAMAKKKKESEGAPHNYGSLATVYGSDAVP